MGEGFEATTEGTLGGRELRGVNFVEEGTTGKGIGLEESPEALLSVGEGCVGRGIAAAGEAVMLRDFSVREQSIACRPSTVVGSGGEPSTASEFSCCSVGCLVASHPSVGRGPDDVDWLGRGILKKNFECRGRNATANEVLDGRLRISDYNVWLRPGDKGQGYCRLLRRCGIRGA